jgi:hypothetical protein
VNLWIFDEQRKQKVHTKLPFFHVEHRAVTFEISFILYPFNFLKQEKKKEKKLFSNWTLAPWLKHPKSLTKKATPVSTVVAQHGRQDFPTLKNRQPNQPSFPTCFPHSTASSFL